MFEVRNVYDNTTDGVRVASFETCGSVCSQQINLMVRDGIVLKAQVLGGCGGNLQGICSLIEGARIEDVISRLEGIDCGGKGTSCPDQIARALKQLL